MSWKIFCVYKGACLQNSRLNVVLWLTTSICVWLYWHWLFSRITKGDDQKDDLGTLIAKLANTTWSSKLIHQYLNIKYAESPSGKQRFKPPVMYVLGPGTHIVNKIGRPCPSFDDIDDLIVDKLNGEDIEDCLSLNVFTGNLSKSNPVMVYIHGGAFERGSSRIAPPYYLLEKDIVLVVPQYRLGPFGFLSTQTDDISGDAALQDILLALKWCQQFISRFGGDPNRVTIFGQSSGSAVISALILSPIVEENLFHKVILQSGSILSTRSYDNNSVKNARNIAKQCGCNENGAITEINDCFMKVDAIQLLRAHQDHVQTNAPKGFSEFGGSKLTHSKILPLSAVELAKTVLTKRNISLMAGVTKTEGTFILSLIHKYLESTSNHLNTYTNKYAALAKILNFIGLSDATGTTFGIIASSFFKPKELRNSQYNNLTRSFVDICGTATVKAPVFQLVNQYAQEHPMQTYLYTFDYKGEFSYRQSLDTLYKGVQHSDDIIYLFPYPPHASKLNVEDTEMAKRMVNLWTSFATTGVPVADGIPNWLPLTNGTGPYLLITKNSTIGDDFFREYAINVHEENERIAAIEAARIAAEEAAKKAAEEAARKMAEEAAKKACNEAIDNAAKNATNEAERKAKEEADRKAAENAAARAAEEEIRKIAEDAAKKACEEAIKEAAKGALVNGGSNKRFSGTNQLILSGFLIFHYIFYKNIIWRI